MSRDRYRDAARILGGKYRPGIPGVRAARAFGEISPIEYEFTWVWDADVEHKGFLRSEERTSFRWHQFRLDCTWSPDPMTIRLSGNQVVPTPAVRGLVPELSEDQKRVLGQAFSTWKDLSVTNHGYELWTRDREETAQEIAVTVQGLALSLRGLVTEPRSRSQKLTDRLLRRKNPTQVEEPEPSD